MPAFTYKAYKNIMAWKVHIRCDISGGACWDLCVSTGGCWGTYTLFTSVYVLCFQSATCLNSHTVACITHLLRNLSGVYVLLPIRMRKCMKKCHEFCK